MQKKKQHKPIRQIITLTILAILLLLLIFAEDIIKLSNKNKIAKNNLETSEPKYTTTIQNNTYDITNLIQDPKDIKPTLSAGMIPIKRDGENWIITTSNDKDWYDYTEYKPAYMMLNDGVYQSELRRDMTGKELAENNVGVGVPDDPEILGTIYMWIPRFVYDDNNLDIELLYMKQECTVWGNYRISNMFKSEADKWDYSYAGIWIEYKPLESETALVNKVNNLNKGENDTIYGLLANTKAYRYDSFSYGLEYYIYTLSEKTMMYTFIGTEFRNVINNTNIIENFNNNNRTVLRVSETNRLEPIKATSYFDTEKEQIIIDVTHNKNEIKEILFANGEKLEFTTTNGKTVANTGDIEIVTGRYIVTIIDVDGNVYRFTTYGEPIYATLYTDGTLGLSTGKTTISGKTVSKSYGDIQLNSNLRPWVADVASIKTVNIVNKIRPTVVSMWFYNCTNLTAISNIANLDTSKVTSMASMFQNCSKLTSLDVSNFDTSKVINMGGMFQLCSSLTSLDLSKWNTSNVTSVYAMFDRCSALRTLNVSNFDTSNVTNMGFMFSVCSSLTSLDLSKWNTSNVISMDYMFQSCSTLTSLDLSSFNVSKVTNFKGMFQNCSKLKTIYVNKSTAMWSSSIKNSTSSSSQYYRMFLNCGTSTVTRK